MSDNSYSTILPFSSGNQTNEKCFYSNVITRMLRRRGTSYPTSPFQPQTHLQSYLSLREYPTSLSFHSLTLSSLIVIEQIFIFMNLFTVHSDLDPHQKHVNLTLLQLWSLKA
jgi:hypothetical protein